MDALASDYDPTINNSIHNHHFHHHFAPAEIHFLRRHYSRKVSLPEAPDEAKRTHIVGIITTCIARERGYYPGPDIGKGERECSVRERACTRSKKAHGVNDKDSGR